MIKYFMKCTLIYFQNYHLNKVSKQLGKRKERTFQEEGEAMPLLVYSFNSKS